MKSESRQLHVFFFPMLAPGHMIPMIDVSRLFAARGAKSTIITTPLNALHIADSVARDKQLGLHISIQTIPFPAVEVGLPEGSENVSSVNTRETVKKFLDAVGMLQQPLEKLIAEHRPDCIVADVFIPWTTDVAEKYGIPRIVFHGTCYFSLCMELIHTYARHVHKDALDLENCMLPDIPSREDQMSRLQLLMDGDGDSDPDNQSAFSRIHGKVEEAELRSFGSIINGVYELEPAYAEYFKKARGRSWNIGPVSLYNTNIADKAQRGKKASIDEHKCLSWLDSKEPNSVLYVSFGSTARICTAQLHEIAKGLDASGVPFIWVVRLEKDQLLPEGLEERVEGRGLIIRGWAPQVLILDHPAVGGFMTHCGWNSTLEGITAGLPLITWPMFAEQFENEMFITKVLKNGISAGNRVLNNWVDPKDMSVTKEMIAEAVAQLMGKGEDAEDRRMRAKELREIAKRAVEEGGSSYSSLTDLIRELQARSM